MVLIYEFLGEKLSDGCSYAIRHLWALERKRNICREKSNFIATVEPFTLKPNTMKRVPVKVRVPDKAGTWIVTADVESRGMKFLDWTEALITVE